MLGGSILWYVLGPGFYSWSHVPHLACQIFWGAPQQGWVEKASQGWIKLNCQICINGPSTNGNLHFQVLCGLLGSTKTNQDVQCGTGKIAQRERHALPSLRLLVWALFPSTNSGCKLRRSPHEPLGYLPTKSHDVLSPSVISTDIHLFCFSLFSRYYPKLWI